MPPDRSHDDFGRTLRQARERRGISLRQVSAATKISIAALQALEENDLSRLPGGIFTRAFVRSYAIEVGLDPDQTVQDFLARFPPDPAAPGGTPAGQVEDGEALESDRTTATTFLRLIMVSVPIAAAVLYLSTRAPRQRVTPPPAEETQSAPIPPPAPPPDPPPAPDPPPSAVSRPAPQAPPEPRAAVVPAARTERPAATDIAAPSPASAPPPAATPSANGFTVALSATGPCWVSAFVDGRRVIERLMQPGDAQTIEVRGDLVLTAGDPAALSVRLNGAETRPLGKPGHIAVARMNAGNFRTYLATP